jgi:aminopeptidase
VQYLKCILYRDLEAMNVRHSVMDQRIVEHAKWLVNYCTEVKHGDQVLIRLGSSVSSGGPDGMELAAEVYKEVSRLGAHPLIMAHPAEAIRGYYELTSDQDIAVTPLNFLELVKTSDVVIVILASDNTHLLANVDPKKIAKRQVALDPIAQEQLNKRWTATIHPTNAFAQDAGMSLTEYRDFVYSAMLRDWKAEIEQMEKLRDVMQKSSGVRLIGKDTDLSFSIKGRTAVIDNGKNNFPGGEVFTAPVDDSASGKIYFDLPSIIYGTEVEGMHLTFEKGIIVNYSAEKNHELLKQMIETDEGSKRLGEFGVGTNRGITLSTKSILFDEKIGGTIHLAIGNAYEKCGGINRSAVHWDMIKTMNPGEVLMDSKTIQKNGKFIWE